MNSVRKPALVIPALNEEEAIGATLASVPPSLFRSVIVVDNGSTDRTAETARAAGAEVVLEPDRGYGAACLRALRALPGDVDAVVFLQADGSEDPAEALRLLAPIYEDKADLVIGSRTLGQAEPGALPPHQRFGNKLATWLIRLLFGYRYTDLGPFRAVRRGALDQLGMRDRNYGWTVEMQVRALRRRLRVSEVPVSTRKRAAGRGKVSATLAGSLRAGAKILWIIARLAIEKPVAPG